MFRKYLVFSFISVLFCSFALLANPKIFNDHKPRLKSGKKVITTCAYCHNDTTGLMKKKGQNIKAIQKNKTCSGKGCHGK